MSAPTAAEIAALTARLREPSRPGRPPDEQERAAFLADKEALLDRIADDAGDRSEPGRLPDRHTRDADTRDAEAWLPMPEWMREQAARAEQQLADGTAPPARPDDPAEIAALIADLHTRIAASTADGVAVGQSADDSRSTVTSGGHDNRDDRPKTESGLSGAEGGYLDPGPQYSAEQAARELAGPDRSLDEARALVAGYLAEVSEQLDGMPVHQWGLDGADLAAIDPARAGDAAAAAVQDVRGAVAAVPGPPAEAELRDDRDDTDSYEAGDALVREDAEPW